MTLHKYGMRLRPFGPACQPKDGLRRAEEDASGKYWNIIYYDRLLPTREAATYDLDYLGETEDE